MNIRELREKSLKIAHEARALLDTIKEDGSNTDEVNAQFEKAMKESDELDARAKKLEAIEAREASYNEADARRPVEDRAAANETDAETRERTFRDYLRNGKISNELRAQSVGTNSAGGYTVPTNLSNQLVEAMKYYGPMVEGNAGSPKWWITADGAPLNIPTMDDTANAASALAENTGAGTDNLTFGQKALPVYKYKTGVFLVPRELLQDSAIDIVQEINDAMAERLGREINTKLTVGTGSGDPQGIAVGASAGITASATGAVTADELFKVLHSLDIAYRAKARWQMNDQTLLAIRTLKDSQNRYLLDQGLNSGNTNSLLGYNIDINNDLPTMAAGTTSILFGDPSRYYARRAGAFEIRRLDERYAEVDQVGFVAFARIGGVVVTSGAIKSLVMAAS